MRTRASLSTSRPCVAGAPGCRCDRLVLTQRGRDVRACGALVLVLLALIFGGAALPAELPWTGMDAQAAVFGPRQP